MSVQMQKQTARNLVVSANSQAAYGGVLADAALLRRMSVDPSTAVTLTDSRYNDQGAAGHGTDFATGDIRTGWDSAATVKGMNGVDDWALGWMLAFIFGAETVTGAGPYTHAFQMANLTATMPCTTLYAEETADIKRKYPDMAAKTLQIDIPERGVIQGTLDMVGTGRVVPGAFSTALPAVPSPNYLLGSDVVVAIAYNGGQPVSYAGRQRGVSIKIDRQSSAFKASGDGLYAGSVQSGTPKFSIDLTLMADVTDDINAAFENFTPLSVTIGTRSTLARRLAINLPSARAKANKISNVEDKVAWALSFDEGTCLQVGNAPAISASIINDCAAYLVPA
ncbi:phage tail tube protein [Granulicella cerasi]|uniref:Phage tail tube protein n=1 Tax=Granulicella cerasi TaxID=741063 RepID=A0ABW1Z7M6_9BACT|nr:phage tail tube protein [Granulicella cerasi]